MSTILKALRRLEEDQPECAEASTPASEIPATDPAAAEELRARILAEEMAAQASTEPEGDLDSTPFITRRRAILAAAVLSVLLFIGVGLTTLSRPPAAELDARSETSEATSPSPDAAAARVAAQTPPKPTPAPARAPTREPEPPTRTAESRTVAAPAEPAEQSRAVVPAAPPPLPIAERAPRASARPLVASRRPEPSRPTPAAAPTARLAIVESPPTPTPAPPVAKRPAPAPRPAAQPTARPRPAATEVGPEIVSAPAPARTPRPEPTPAPSRPESRAHAAQSPPPTPKPTPTPSSSAEPIARLPRPDIPAVNIVRTSWHPQADRRSARIRLEGSDETMNLREGDAVGALVVKEITPSSVLFETGGIEIRRRVGGVGGVGGRGGSTPR